MRMFLLNFVLVKLENTYFRIKSNDSHKSRIIAENTSLRFLRVATSNPPNQYSTLSQTDQLKKINGYFY